LCSILIVSLLTIGLASSGLAQTTYTITDLGSLGYSSVGQGINASGQVTGYSQGTDFTIHAFLYSGGSMTDLGNLGDSFSVGTGINASGQVTGYSAGTDHNIHAFLYSGGSMTDVGTLGGSSSNGFGINDYGQVTGTSLMLDTNVHAFLYTPGTGMVDLNSLLPSGSGWTLITANGINDAGQITGDGLNPNGADHAFLLSPAVPFSAFAAKLEISGRPPTSFEINGSFTLGVGSNGISPVNEAVTLKLGTFSVTMPQGSLKKSYGGRYVFEGTIDGVALELGIVPVTTNTYTFNAECSGANLSGTVKPVSVVLTIGDDHGTTTSTAK